MSGETALLAIYRHPSHPGLLYYVTPCRRWRNDATGETLGLGSAIQDGGAAGAWHVETYAYTLATLDGRNRVWWNAPLLKVGEAARKAGFQRAR